MIKSLTNKTKNLKLAFKVEEATGMFKRNKGLLGRTHIAADSTLWIARCNSIHTFFMQFTIDAVFVDRKMVVRKVCRDIKPWRLILPVWGASSVFEMAQGQASRDKVEEGDQLDVGH